MGAFKLGKMTFGSLFKKPETILYPFQVKEPPAGLKGHIVIDADQCIVCGLCDKSCSTDCIKVDRKARTWEIDPFGCVQCGYCVTVCPKKCLAMDPHYFPAGVKKVVERFEIPEQEKAASKAAPKAATPMASQSEKAPVHVEQSRDEQLEGLIALMDESKAEKVKTALKL